MGEEEKKKKEQRRIEEEESFDHVSPMSPSLPGTYIRNDTRYGWHTGKNVHIYPIENIPESGEFLRKDFIILFLFPPSLILPPSFFCPLLTQKS